MDGLLERVRENQVDALYLFINEILRNREEFDRFSKSLLLILPQNWSINRLEIGHEFLSMVNTFGKQQQLFGALFDSLHSLRTLIISDGYVPRKDHGCVNTVALLDALPKAKNLQTLDLQRVKLQNEEEVEILADYFELQESLEDIRITGLILSPCTSLDPVIKAFCEMPNLRSLSISSCYDHILQLEEANNDDNAITDTSTTATSRQSNTTNSGTKNNFELFTCLHNLLQLSTTLQDLTLRSMNLDDDKCTIIANALSADGNCFLTSLDIRQNNKITSKGYSVILNALERNYDLWCSVLVDDDTYQAKFNSLIVMNQANRGDLVRNPTKEKLIAFLDHVKDDPTALFHFLTIHDSVLFPIVNFLKWKNIKETSSKPQQKIQELKTLITTTTGCTTAKRQNNNIQGQQEDTNKRIRL